MSYEIEDDPTGVIPSDATTAYQSELVDSELPSQAPIRIIGSNKVEELVQDNRMLRAMMGQTAESLLFEHSKLETFYRGLKTKCNEITSAFERQKGLLDEKDRAIAHLKAEKCRLSQELMENRLSGLSVVNGEQDKKLKAEVDDTVRVLQRELLKSEEKMKMRESYHQQQLEVRENTWRNWGMEVTEDWRKFVEQLQTDHNLQLQEQLREHEASERRYKDQVTSLIKEVKGYESQLHDKEAESIQWQSQLEGKENRIYQLSKEARGLEDANRTMTEDVIRLKQELEDAQRRINEKEESLDQLFRVYNEEREKNQRHESEKTEICQSRDKFYAQYLSAEESIKKKNEEITALQDRLRERHSSAHADPENEIVVYKQQAQIFKKDFEMEREARMKVVQENEHLKTMMGQYNMEMQKLKTELMKYHQASQQYPQRP